MSGSHYTRETTGCFACRLPGRRYLVSTTSYIEQIGIAPGYDEFRYSRRSMLGVDLLQTAAVDYWKRRKNKNMVRE